MPSDRFDLEDTISYKIINQITDHSFGGDIGLDAEDVVSIYTIFVAHGGSWENVIMGDPSHMTTLEEVAKQYVQRKDLERISKNVSNF